MKRLRKILAVLIAVSLFIIPITVNAEGDPNVDGGGDGGWGGAVKNNFWNAGDEGARITLIDATTGEPRSISVDISNKKITDIRVHFGKISKTDYRAGVTLSPQVGGYEVIQPQVPLPKMITSASGRVNILAIKSYFTDVQILKYLSSILGVSYEEMIAGELKLLVEPVGYITYNGVRTALTPTEAALYDQRMGGDMSRKMPSFTHKNFPLSLFLEKADIGYQAWTGPRDGRVTDDQIINYLGMGIVRFTDRPGTIPEFDAADYEYRTDTDVITSVYVNGGQSDPDHPVNVTFQILGRNYIVSNVYYPKDGQQIAWVKWHTPSTPQRVTINVYASGSARVSKTTITANINELQDNPPPNPVADDRNDSYSKALATVPSNAEVTSASWSVWRCVWHPNLVWHPKWKWHEDWKWHENWQYVSIGHSSNCPPNCTIDHKGWRDEGEYVDEGKWVDEGKYVDEGWWDFYLDHYSASLQADMSLTTDAMNPTAVGDVMKSGYGVNVSVNSRVTSTNYGAVTGAQNAMSFFPEFYYKIYWRLLDMTSSGYRSEFQFKTNPYSTYGRRVHFSPIWMPDGDYKVYTYLFDAWTPTGELRMNVTDHTTISGNLWSDWHIAPKNPD